MPKIDKKAKGKAGNQRKDKTTLSTCPPRVKDTWTQSSVCPCGHPCVESTWTDSNVYPRVDHTWTGQVNGNKRIGRTTQLPTPTLFFSSSFTPKHPSALKQGLSKFSPFFIFLHFSRSKTSHKLKIIFIMQFPWLFLSF